MARFWTARDRCHGTRSPSTGFCNEPARRSSPTNSDFDEENGKSWCEATMRAVDFVPGARALGLRLMDRCRPVPETSEWHRRTQTLPKTRPGSRDSPIPVGKDYPVDLA